MIQNIEICSVSFFLRKLMNKAFIITKSEFRKYIKHGYKKYNSIIFLPKEKNTHQKIHIHEINEDKVHLTGFYFTIEFQPILCNNVATGFFYVTGCDFPRLKFNKRNLNRIYFYKKT